MQGIDGVEDVSFEYLRNVVSHATSSLEGQYDWSFLDAYPQGLLKSASKIHLVVDYDVDGLCSAAILHQYLDRMGKDVSIRTFSRKEGFKVCPDDLRKDRLNIVLDRGSPEIGSGVYEKFDVLIIDHHQIPKSGKGNEIVVNPRAKECSKYPCTSLIVQKLFGTNESIPLAILGSLGDVSQFDRETHEFLYHSWKDETPWGRFRSPQHVRFSIATKLNSCGRMGRTEEALEFLIRPSRKAWSKIIGIDRERREEVEKARPLMSLRMEFVNMDVFSPVYAGHISYLAQRLCHGDVMGIAGYYDVTTNGYRVSIRHSKPVLDYVFSLYPSLGGHPSAGGGWINGYDLSTFLRKANEIIAYSKNKICVDYPSLKPNHLQSKELIEALETVSLNPPVAFKGSEEWLKIENVNSERRKRPTYHQGVLHWGRPGERMLMGVTSFRRKVEIRWL